MSKKTIIAIDKIGGVLEDKDTFIEKGMEKESARRYVCKLLLRIAEINTVLNNRSIHKVPEYNKLCALKAERDSAFEEVWKIYTEYHNIIIQEPKTIGNMTAEELVEVLKTVNANRPQVTQTMNFNAPIGQQIAHVDKIEAHFDKDMGMQITNADEVSKQGVQNASLKKKTTPATKEKGNKPVAKKDEKPKVRELMTFGKGNGVADGHIIILYAKLTKAGWMDGTEEDFKDLFSGKSKTCWLTWKGKFGKSTLEYLFAQMIEAKVVKLPDGFTLSSILEGHFKDAGGLALVGLGKGDEPNRKTIGFVAECVHLLTIDPSQMTAEEFNELYGNAIDTYDHQDLNVRKRRL